MIDEVFTEAQVIEMAMEFEARAAALRTEVSALRAEADACLQFAVYAELDAAELRANARELAA